MIDWTGLSPTDIWVYQMMLLDLLIAVAIMAGLRYLTGLVANVNSAEELASRDNVAFGLSMAGGVLALALMLTGALSGEAGRTLLAELLAVLGYGLLGLLLIKGGRIIQDRLVLTGIEIQAQIKSGNLAAAVVDVGNTIAVGLILRAVMLWTEGDALVGAAAVLGAFVVTQVLLALVTRWRLAVYAGRHAGGSLQQALADGNAALAVRYLGHVLGVALAVTAASGVVVFDLTNLPLTAAAWTGVCLLFMGMVSLLAMLARRVILVGIDVVEEVDRQHNTGVAAIEAAISIAVGLFIAGLFG